MKKRILAVLIVCCMLLTGCSNVVKAVIQKNAPEASEEVNVEAEETEQAEKAEAEKAEAVDEANSVDEEDTAASDVVKKLIEAEMNAAEESEDAAGSKYARGILSGTSYESEFLGLRFEAPEDTVMGTQEELDEIAGISIDMVSEDLTEIQRIYAEASVVYEMINMIPTGNPNIIVCTEKLMLKSITVDQYVEVASQQYLEMWEAEIVSSDTDVEIAGEQYRKLEMILDDGSFSQNQDCYIRKVDDRMLLINVTYVDEEKEKADEMLGSFKPY